MPRTPFVIALVATVALWAFSAEADTSIHGFSIPTVEDGLQPSLEVCTTTGDALQWQNTGTNRTGVMVCQPRPEVGVRPVHIPPQVVEALEIIEASVNFDHDSVKLSELEMEAVRVVAAWLRDVPNARIVLAGHTDATGTDAYNMDLSERRARQVAAFLSANGIDSSRIDLEWYGESQLLENTQKRSRTNRRVELTPRIGQ